MPSDIAKVLVSNIAWLISTVLWAYTWIIIIRALISWVNPDPYNPIVRGLYAVTEPVLSPLRRRLPLFAGSIDFSPIVLLLLVEFLRRIIDGLFAVLLARM